MPSGQLTVTVSEAQRLKETEFLSKQDPYAVVKVGATKNKTKTHWNGSSMAKWNETFVFDIKNDHELFLEIWNKNTFSDDLIGKARHNLDKVFHTKQDSCWITVKRGNDKDSGYVHLILKFQPSGVVNGNNAPITASIGLHPPAYGAPPAPYPYNSSHAPPLAPFQSPSFSAPANPYPPAQPSNAFHGTSVNAHANPFGQPPPSSSAPANPYGQPPPGSNGAAAAPNPHANASSNPYGGASVQGAPANASPNPYSNSSMNPYSGASAPGVPANAAPNPYANGNQRPPSAGAAPNPYSGTPPIYPPAPGGAPYQASQSLPAYPPASGPSGAPAYPPVPAPAGAQAYPPPSGSAVASAPPYSAPSKPPPGYPGGH